MGSPLLWFGNAAKFLKSQIIIPGSTSGSLTVQPAAVTTPYTLTMPATQGGATTTINNDGAGNLTWVNGLPAVGTDGQLLKSMNSTYIQSSYYNPYPNYIGNAFAELNTNGWATYSNTASNIPVNGTGGTATGLTFSRTTSSPLRDTGTFSIVQANSTSLQGKGVSYAFTIDSADQAKALSIQLDYNASSTFVASNGTTAPLNDGTTTTNAGNSDLEVFIYDVTNSVLLPVSPQVFTANGSNNFTFKGTFQTSSNSTSYRLILHVATTSANATGWTFKFTNVYVGPQYIVQGSPITDPVAYTPTLDNFGTCTNVSVWYNQEGAFFVGYGSFTAGTEVAATAAISLPSGLSIDYSRITTATNLQTVGYFISTETSAQNVFTTTGYSSIIFADGSTTNKVFMAVTLGNTAQQLTKANATTLGSSNTAKSFYFRVPILNWSSSTQMSNAGSTQVVAMSADTATTSYTANTPVVFTNVVGDSLGSYSASTGRYTIPVSGWYDVEGSVYSSSPTASSSAYIYKDGTQYSQSGATLVSTQGTMIQDLIYLTAGQIIDIRINNNQTLTNTSNTRLNRFTIAMRQGPAQLAVLNSINGRYFSSVTAITGSLVTIVYATKGWDTSGLYNSSTGIWTCQVSGKYFFNAAIATAGTIALNNALDLQIQQSGSSSQISESLVDAGGAVTNLGTSVSDEFYCLPGDTIKVQVSSGATLPTIVSSNSKNYFSWARIGN